MDQPQITVTKQTYTLPTTVLGKDDQGRTLVACPFCGDEAAVEQDGRVACPTGQAIQRMLDEARPALEKAVDDLFKTDRFTGIQLMPGQAVLDA